MRLVLGNLLLFLALGFKSTNAQETTETYKNITSPLLNANTVEPTLSSEITSATYESAATLQQTKANLHKTETPIFYETPTMLMEPTGRSTSPPSTETEHASVESGTTPVQIKQTTVTTLIVPVNVETTVTEQTTRGAPSTIRYETTARFTSPKSTSPTERPTEDITTAAEAKTTESTEALSPTSILTTPPADWTTSKSTSIMPMFDPVDTITETSSTPTSTSTAQFPQNTTESKSDLVSTDFTEPGSVKVEESNQPLSSNWLLIIIVLVGICFALCVGVILFTQQRKKNASRNFGPMHMNGQSKRSKRKKGAEDDAWAGPVKLEAGLGCEAEVQEDLRLSNGKLEGDDMVLSTFAALDAGDESNGGVGGDGTKEAKKWEEQEPLLYIDEDANEDKTGTTPEESKERKGEEKSEEKGMNGGETFCLTTAV